MHSLRLKFFSSNPRVGSLHIPLRLAGAERLSSFPRKGMKKSDMGVGEPCRFWSLTTLKAFVELGVVAIPHRYRVLKFLMQVEALE
jgi:hypothetical protein